MMVTFKALLLELLILANYYWYKTQSEGIVFQIGALLSSKDVLDQFQSVVNANLTFNDTTIRFEGFGEVMNQNTLQTTDQVCDFIARSRHRLCALVVSHPPKMREQPPLAASFTAAFFDLPTLGITARQSAFSDKNSHSNFIRTITPYSQEASVFIALIRFFGWKHINVIYTDDHEGKTMLTLLEKLSGSLYHISTRVALKEDTENYTSILTHMSQEQTRIVLLYCKSKYAEGVYTTAKQLGMFDQDWAWLVTERALNVKNVPPGVLGVQLSKSSELDHMSDAISVIKKGVVATIKSNVKKMKKALFRSTCVSKSMVYGRRGQVSTMQMLLRAMLNVKLVEGATGAVSFNDAGDREQARYHIVNMRKDGTLESVGIFDTNSPTFLADGRPAQLVSEGDLKIDMKQIKWPPGDYQITIKKEVCQKAEHMACGHKVTKLELAAPKSFKKKTHLLVVTKNSTPFVYSRLLKKGEVCRTTSETNTEVECSHTDPKTKKKSKKCCFGYCIDLLRRLANRTRGEEPDSTDMETSFSYDLHLVGDNEIGELTYVNGQKKWTGIVEELYEGVADLGVAPMTITPERATRIEFTKPFKYLGLTILVKRESHPKSNLGSFLQPFANTLWVLVFLSVHVVALVLYLLDRFSPFGRYKFARGADTEEDALNLSSAMWFAWGVLLNSGIGEGTPRSFSARVLGMVWAGFAMIIVASYTANLAAFLVLDRPEALLSGIDDARLRNPQKDFKFATVKGSHVEAYFKSQLEYDTMVRIMTKNVFHTVEEAIAAVKTGELKAFIWDSARLEFEAAKDCDLKTAGEVFGRTGYGLAMRKDSPWLYEISQAVLNFHESGVMEELDSKWILAKSKECSRTDTSPATLGLTNMAGVFIMVAAGIVVGVFLIFIEMAYKKRTGLKEKELELARNAADRWRGNIEKRKILRKTMAAERMEKNMPLIGTGGVSSFPQTSFNNPTYERPRDCTKRTVRLTNQDGIFAEQPTIDCV